MELRSLGKTGIQVSRLGFGALTIGPLQAGLSSEDGGRVIRVALDAGVNFIDTAELYGTYSHIRAGLNGFVGDVIIASKSYAYEYQAMEQSVHTACREIGRDYIDIFSLHEQTSRLTLKGHRPALDFLVKAKERGLVRAIGVSTHTVEVVRAAALIEEIDVIHPIINKAGLGILDGTVDDMLAAIDDAASAGKGIYGMKALGGGHLGKYAQQAFSWILNKANLASVVVGMQTPDEVAFNCAIFEGRKPLPEQVSAVAGKKRRLLIEDWCAGCGQCVARCPMSALTLEQGKAVVDQKRCVLCGYCASVCSEFCLKVI
ncbi:MAG: Aldo/keto reductase family protein [Anaerosporomusa subterranea]|jgi:aryl-alcohol dehydrogenase-like predicted oxidoreductase/ferredoxin|nr:Aldo/keto reductase family protein [Anaerosporomusa subterranea]